MKEEGEVRGEARAGVANKNNIVMYKNTMKSTYLYATKIILKISKC